MANELPVLACDGGAARKVITDPAGGPATYGASVTIEGMLEISIDFAADSKEKKDGMGRLLHKQSSAATATGKIKFAKFSPDLHNLFHGSTTVTLSNGGTRVRITPNDRPNFVQVEAVSAPLDGDIGNSGIRLYKVKAQNPSAVAFAEDDYTDYEIDVDIFAMDADGSWVDVTNYTTARGTDELFSDETVTP